ncbi:FBD-associated F-box protein [Hibiscus syriacus]|uniref:FBD-associated F-box protein n=1 Tax=Hibiscus syriacus TaxID=106335 RepID=A0A6A2YG21_HIBSY|nr:FBD-associated F-box protein [Hibiscus syriacus]
MSVNKTLALNNGDQVVKSNVTDTNRKRRRFNQCFSFKEVQVEPVSSLKDLDSTKFKAEIKRWAKAVVAYARQASGKFREHQEN